MHLLVELHTVEMHGTGIKENKKHLKQSLNIIVRKHLIIPVYFEKEMHQIHAYL